MVQAKTKATARSVAEPAAKSVSEPASVVAPSTVEVTEETLLATRGRALALLAGVGGVEGIRLALAARGYTEHTHREGWELLQAASSYRPASPVGVPSLPDAAAEAVREIDAWDDTNFPIAAAALKHRHPEAFAAVFAGELQAGDGAESVVRVGTFLDRLDVLPSAQKAALETLAHRGITPAERARLRKLLATATSFRAVDAAGDAQSRAHRAQSLAEREAALRALRAWYEEWSVIARQVIRRKDWLILLGLATRKKPAKPAQNPPTPG